MALVKEEEFRGTERFQIQRRLGAGAFGVVYQAFDRERNCVVALKTLRESNVEALYRLKREFRALADIVHPNLITLHELLTHEEQWFFTMELVEGLNFLQFVRGELPITPALPDEPTSPAPPEQSPTRSEPVSRHPARPERIRSALRQVVAGLQALHRAGQLHRDIKPSNVLITREGRLVLLDFGLATDLSLTGSKRTSSIVGTPAYMSPEQGSAKPLSPASDWYSVGVMLFEALTGRWPFTGSFVEMMWDKRHTEPPPPRELAPGTPEDLNTLCRDLLRTDPEMRPTGDQILARLGAVQAATYQATASSLSHAPPFVGRVPHLAALRSAFEASRAGRPVVVRLHGPSGAGKTALARRFLEEVRRSGAVVLSGRCYERESVPYKALDSLVDAMSQFLKKLPSTEAHEILPRDVLALARLFPVLRRVESIAGAKRRVLDIPDSQELRRRAFAALRELLARLAEQHDLVLFIDDLQWGDVDSAALLTDLLRPPRPPSILLIACYRSEEATTSPFLSKFLSPGATGDAAELRELPVGELTEREAKDLALALLGGEPDASEARVEEIARESGGNPFFLSELVRYAQAGVAPSEAGLAARTGSPGAPGRATTLEEVIRSRVLRLPEEARRLLEIVAVAGHPLRPALARHVAGLEGKEDTIDLLRASHLIRTRSSPHRDEIEPYHDRIRETVVAQLSREQLKAHHRSLATALEGSGSTDPEALALHFQEAGEPERAAEYSAAAAARASETLAFDRAARLYRLALELRSTDDRTARQALCVKLGDTLSNAGHGAEAANAYLEAVAGAPAADSLELRRRAAEQFLISGRIEEGLWALQTVLEPVGMRLARSPREALFSMLLRRLLVRIRGVRFRERDATQLSPEKLTRIDICWSAAKGLGFSDPIQGNDFQSRQLLLALRAGEPYRVARALASEAGYSAMAGGRTRRRTASLLAAATALANRHGHPHAIGFTMSVAGIAAYLEGRWRTARERAQAASTVLQERCRAVAWELDNAHYYSLLSLSNLGNLRELADTLPALLKEAQDRGDLYFATNMRTRFLYLLRLSQDQPRQAQEELQQAMKGWSRHRFLLQHWYELYGLTECSLYAGEAGTAWQNVRSRWPLLKRSLLLRVQTVLINSLQLRARCAIAMAAAAENPGDSENLLEQAQKDARRIEREAMPWGNGLAKLLRAGAAASRREAEATLALLMSAEEEFAAADMALHATVARRRRGELLGGEDGRVLIAAADDWMAGQGIQNPERMAAMLAPGAWC